MDIKTLITVGDRVRFLRKNRGLTQVQLSHQSGIEQGTLSDLERGKSKSPAASTLLRLAAVLEASSEWIMTGKGDPFELAQVGPHTKDAISSIYDSLPDVHKSALLAAALALQGANKAQ